MSILFHGTPFFNSLHLLNDGREMVATITDLIKKQLRTDGKTITWLANHLGESTSNTHRKLSANTVDVDYLERICMVMQYDFFALYSQTVKQKMKEKSLELNEPESRYAAPVPREQFDALLQENVQLYRKLEICRDELNNIRRKP